MASAWSLPRRPEGRALLRRPLRRARRGRHRRGGLRNDRARHARRPLPAERRGRVFAIFFAAIPVGSPPATSWAGSRTSAWAGARRSSSRHAGPAARALARAAGARRAGSPVAPLGSWPGVAGPMRPLLRNGRIAGPSPATRPTRSRSARSRSGRRRFSTGSRRPGLTGDGAVRRASSWARDCRDFAGGGSGPAPARPRGRPAGLGLGDARGRARGAVAFVARKPRLPDGDRRRGAAPLRSTGPINSAIVNVVAPPSARRRWRSRSSRSTSSATSLRRRWSARSRTRHVLRRFSVFRSHAARRVIWLYAAWALARLWLRDSQLQSEVLRPMRFRLL